jgi:hypothetical protein
MIAESPDEESGEMFTRGLLAVTDYVPDRDLAQIVIDEVMPSTPSDIAG